MNHEFKTMLIENITEYKNSVLDEISSASDPDELLRLLDKIISLQYYKGCYNIADEYDEIISSKINELYDVEIENESYSNNEFKYFLKELLEFHDLFLSKLEFNIEITDSIKIKTEYLISELDSSFYLDELSSEYLAEIIVYESKDELISFIQDNILYELSNIYLLNYFNYDEYISDNEYYELEYNSDIYNSNIAYIEDINRLY